MENSIWKPFRPKYIIGCDLSTHKADYSTAIICKITDGKLEVIDMKSSKDSNEVKKFVETYEPEFFTFKYQSALTTGRIFQSEYLGEMPQETIHKRKIAFDAMFAYEKNCVEKYDRMFLPSLPIKKGEYMSDFAAMYGTTVKEMKECEAEVEIALGKLNIYPRDERASVHDKQLENNFKHYKRPFEKF